ncbi:MAG: hypothetical protein GY862_32050 [Gammaproteobacteria bacterium]|nr:hypothetical protein [Gammaproteobacteria bacterium]
MTKALLRGFGVLLLAAIVSGCGGGGEAFSGSSSDDTDKFTGGTTDDTTPVITLPAGAAVFMQALDDISQTANGIDAVRLLVRALDSEGRPLTDMPVSFAFYPLETYATAESPTGQTNANGQYTTSITNLRAEKLTVIPIVGSVAVSSASVTLIFTAVDLTPAERIDLTVVRNNQPADGSSTIELLAIARDSVNAPIANLSISLSSSSSTTVFEQVVGTTGDTGEFRIRLTNTVEEIVKVTVVGGGATGYQDVSFGVGTGVAVTTVRTTVEGSPAKADGSDSITITAVAEDVDGNRVVGASAYLEINLGSASVNPETGTTDRSGRYIARVTSEFVGNVEVTAVIGGTRAASKDTLSFISTPGSDTDVDKVIVNATPVDLPADGVATATVYVVLRDDSGAPIAGAEVNLSALPSPGSSENNSATAVFDQLIGVTGSNGYFVTQVANTAPGTLLIEAKSGSKQGFSNNVTFVTTGAIKAASVQVTVANNNRPANGTEAATLKVIVRGEGGLPVEEGRVVTLVFNATTSGSLSSAVAAKTSGITDAGGSFQTTITDTMAESFRITATVDGKKGISPLITFEASAATTEPEFVTVSADRTGQVADGKAEIVLMIIARDKTYTPIKGVSVSLATDNERKDDPNDPAGAAVVSLASDITGSNGAVSATVTSTREGNIVITPTAGTTEGTSITLSFGSSPTGAEPHSVEILVHNDNAAANGTDLINLDIAVRNEQGQPLKDVQVSLSACIAPASPEPDGNCNNFEPAPALPAARFQSTPAGTTSELGIFSTTMSSNKAEAILITANAGGKEVTKTISFVATTTPSRMVLRTESPQLDSEGRDEGVLISAYLTTAANTPAADIEIKFKTTSGLIQTVEGTTNASGVATARLTTNADPINRNITITAFSSNLSDEMIDVEVIGTTLSITGPSSATVSNSDRPNPIKFDVVLKNSAGQGIFGIPLAVSSQAKNVISFFENDQAIAEAKTDVSGHLEVRIENVEKIADDIDHDDNVDTPNISGDKLTVQLESENIDKELYTELYNPHTPLVEPDSHSFSISDDVFTVTLYDPAPNPDPDGPRTDPRCLRSGDSVVDISLLPDIPLNTRCEFKIQWKKISGTEDATMAGAKVELTATRGNVEIGLLAPPPCFDTLGKTAVNEVETCFIISADNAGPVTIVAKIVQDGTGNPLSGPITEVDFDFYATEADSMVLQANPSVIEVNPPGSSNEQSEITAVIRDGENNLVKNKRIDFTLTDVTGGGISPSTVTTDQFGRASTVYTAGSSPSASDGVIITAEPADTGSIYCSDGRTRAESCSVYLTVGGKALFVTLGTANKLADDGLRYEMPYTVLVTDADSHPVSEANVEVTLYVTIYKKGGIRSNDDNNPLIDCPNEDFNRNGLLEPGEDLNDNKDLDPGNVITVDNAKLITDVSGFADFNLVYAKQYGFLLNVEVTATASVGGSEGSRTVNYHTGCTVADCVADASIRWPNEPNPFGWGGNEDRPFDQNGDSALKPPVDWPNDMLDIALGEDSNNNGIREAGCFAAIPCHNIPCYYSSTLFPYEPSLAAIAVCNGMSVGSSCTYPTLDEGDKKGICYTYSVNQKACFP